MARTTRKGQGVNGVLGLVHRAPTPQQRAKQVLNKNALQGILEARPTQRGHDGRRATAWCAALPTPEPGTLAAMWCSATVQGFRRQHRSARVARQGHRKGRRDCAAGPLAGPIIRGRCLRIRAHRQGTEGAAISFPQTPTTLPVVPHGGCVIPLRASCLVMSRHD